MPEQLQIPGLWFHPLQRARTASGSSCIYFTLCCVREAELQLCPAGFLLELRLEQRRWNFSWSLGGSECRTPQLCPRSGHGQQHVSGNREMELLLWPGNPTPPVCFRRERERENGWLIQDVVKIKAFRCNFG